MAISALDSAIFADMFGTAPMRETFGDDPFLARCIEVEAALARAQGRLGIIPAEAADAITHAANSLASGREALDLARLKNQTETVGCPNWRARRAGICIGAPRPRTSWTLPRCCRSAPGSF